MDTIGFWGWLAFLFMIPFVAWLDWVIFGRYLRCENCGTAPPKWNWVLPCTLEFLFFMAGVLLGLAGGGLK